MSKIEDGGPAFPVADWDHQTFSPKNIEETRRLLSGMSLRDAMAIAALQGLCANPGGPFQACDQSGWRIVNCTFDQIADEAYGMADAMLRARTQEPSQ